MRIQSGSIAIIILLMLFSGIAAAQRLTVEARFANIRSGPGTTYDILWNVEKYHPVFVIKKTGSWYHFRDFEGDEGWIHQSLVGKTPSVITKKEKCNIRSGPGNKYKILHTIGKGIPFKIIKRKGNWIQIQHADGDKGWIYKSLIW
jgi:SH3-like domain-containing protein